MKRIGFIDGRRVAGFTLRGATALDGQRLNISDVIEVASGTTRGVHINYTQSGAKTGSAEVRASAISLALNASVPYACAHRIYLGSSNNPTLGFVSPISIYVDDLGTGVTGFVGIDIGLALTNAPSSRHCFMRMRNHVGTLIGDVFRIEGAHIATNLFRFDSTMEPVVPVAVGGVQTHKIRVQIATTPYYIPLHTA